MALSQSVATGLDRPRRSYVDGGGLLPRGTEQQVGPLVGSGLGLTVLSTVDGHGPGLALIVLALLWPVVLAAFRRPSAVGGEHLGRSLARTTMALALTHWLATAVDLRLVGSPAVLAFLGSAVLGTALTQLAMDRHLRRDARPLRTLLVGDALDTTVLLEELDAVSGGRLLGIGACPGDAVSDTIARLRPDLVVAVAGPELARHELQRLGWELERLGMPWALHTGLADVHPTRASLATAGSLGLLEVSPSRRGGVRAIGKAAWERSAAVLGLVLMAPLLAVLAVLIRRDSPGPAFFRQLRVGRDGQLFTMYKLRTMRCDAEAVRDELVSDLDGTLFKVRADPRVTRVGRLLRRYSLDELPQLLNVARGEMALVGPRPALPAEVESYDVDPRRRLAVKPGLTGLWQVSGRSDLSWAESVRLDLDYVDNWTLARDLAILARTIGAVVGHRGAY